MKSPTTKKDSHLGKQRSEMKLRPQIWETDMGDYRLG